MGEACGPAAPDVLIASPFLHAARRPPPCSYTFRVGSKAAQVCLQESAKYLDAFVAAVPDASDLRSVSETLRVMLLRGCPLKLTGRNTAETVRLATQRLEGIDSPVGWG